jgi:uncharacterized protein (TIGR02271 family)
MDTADGDRLRVERAEERLVPETAVREAGRVRIERRVVEEPEEIDVTLRHDEVDIERHPADRPLEAGEELRSDHGDTTVVLRTEERVEVRRVPWVVEEVHIHRRLATSRHRVSSMVRKERIDIRPEGDVHLEQR